MPPSTMAMLMIGGLMSGLCAMLLMVNRRPQIAHVQQQPEPDIAAAGYIHACGLLIFTAVPLANFLLCYYLWIKYRGRSAWLDRTGIEALNFQISVYLYLLLSTFMVFAVIGLLTTPLILLFHLTCVIAAIIQTVRGKQFRYPANIPVIQGRSGSA
ncbi:MAG: DUF4870 domain-containing protein [Arenicella sp.]|nr:DUF4870 domain-containing protein [Arenicella sp.]